MCSVRCTVCSLKCVVYGMGDSCLQCAVSYYPVVPTDVGTTSSCDMTNFEASGGLG